MISRVSFEPAAKEIDDNEAANAYDDFASEAVSMMTLKKD